MTHNVWKRTELRSLLTLDLDRVAVSPGTSYPMVGVYSFGRGLFEREVVDGGNTSYRHLYKLRPEHIVMSQLFGWEGALALSDSDFAGKFVSPQFPTFLTHPDRLDRRFLGWYMKRPAFWEELGTRTRGMGDRRRTLNPDALFASEIPLPPLSEQNRIVNRIEYFSGKLAEAAHLHRQITTEVDEICRSMLREASTTSIPMGELVRRRTADVTVEPNESYHFAGVYCFGRGLFVGQRKTGMEFQYPKLTRLRTDDFVYPKLMAWEGALGIVPPECDGLVVSTEFPVFEVNRDKVLPEVLDVFFRTPQVWPQLSGASTGTNVRRRRLNPADFLRLPFPLPEMEAQIRLRRVKSQVEKLRQSRDASMREISSLMPSILEHAFRGELLL